MWTYFMLTLIIHLRRGFTTAGLSDIKDVRYAGVSDIKDVRYYEIVEPSHVEVNGNSIHRTRRSLSTFDIKQNKHLEETAFSFSGHNRNFLLHIYKNNLLIPDSFIGIHQATDGSYVFNRRKAEHCYYHGYLGNRVKSSVAVSTCHGLNGVIRDEDDEEFVIEPHPQHNATYILYKSKDVMTTTQRQCGVNHTHTADRAQRDYGHQHGDGLVTTSMLTVENITEHHRTRRSTHNTKYIEVTVIMDNLEFKHFKDVNRTQHRGLEILNFVDSYYKTMNTRVVVTNLLVWNVVDKSNVTKSAGETLDALEIYTRDELFQRLKLNMDNVQMISRAPWGGLVGLAGVNNICSRTSSSVNQDHATRAHETANTVAHEMGHNIGFMHYKCDCVNGPCVMSSGVPSDPCKGFASCTKKDYESKLAEGELPCLLDYPTTFYRQPICGNGLLEKGEACDCGTEAECIASNSTKCCEFSTCKLKATAQCATGECCHDCMFKQKGTICRHKLNVDCDLEEVCTGRSSKCPANFYVQDGKSCKNDTAYCYQGVCKTHDTECKMLWGPNAMKANDICFKANLNSADKWNSCGKNNKDEYIKCSPGNQLCGKLQCTPIDKGIGFPTFPIIGSNRGKRIVTHYGSTTIKCIQGKTSVSDDMEDPTITSSGVKCANQSICFRHECVNISTFTHIKKCHKGCANGGICNNNGNCHCLKGYGCPYCETRGPGGSRDSGQGCLEPCDDCLSTTTKALLFIFLLGVPLVLVTIFLIYHIMRGGLKNKFHQTKVADEGDNDCLREEPKERMNRQSIGSVDNPYITYEGTTFKPPAPPVKPQTVHVGVNIKPTPPPKPQMSRDVKPTPPPKPLRLPPLPPSR